MKKRIGYLALVILAILIAIVCVFHLKGNPVRYIEKATGVDLPDGISGMEVYDNGENYLTAQVFLPKDTLPDFISKNEFKELTADNEGFDSNIVGTENLKKFVGIRKGSGLYFLKGHSELNRWRMLVDPGWPVLWVTVFYPDAAGGKP